MTREHYKCEDCGHTFTVVIDVYQPRCQHHACDSTNTTRKRRENAAQTTQATVEELTQ